MFATIVVAGVTTSTAIAGIAVSGPSALASVAARRLPPPDFKTLAKIFNPELKKLGLRTSRAVLQNDTTYASDPHGTRLALYAKPLSTSYTDAEYVAHFIPVARVFLPSIFKRWKGLRSFDLCQEPRPGEDPRREPPPVTQIYVTREGAEHTPWRTATIADLLVASTHTRPTTKRTGMTNDVFVYFEAQLATQPALAAAHSASGTPG